MKKSHFSILYAVIRPEIQERIAVGILLVDNSKVCFSFSKTKINALRELMPQHNYSYLKELLSNIKNSIDQQNFDDNKFFGIEQEIKKPFSLGYLEYVSRYSNNILNFSAPKVIDMAASEILYDNLFKKYIDENPVSREAKTNRLDSLKLTFFPRIESYFNIDKEVSSNEIEKLILPLKIDLIGKNDIPVFAQVIDLERSFYHIKGDLGVISLLNECFTKSKAFIITQEPNKIKFPQQHDIWNNLSNWQEADRIDVSEIQLVEEYALEHNVTPF